MAVCEKMAMSPLAASPLVTCRTERVTVKLPRDAELKKVKRHGEDDMVRGMQSDSEAEGSNANSNLSNPEQNRQC